MSSGCNCGSNCSCGSSCNCGKMYPDVETAPTTVVIIDQSPKGFFIESGEKSFGAEGGHGCKCGSNCKCDPCNC